MPLFVADVFAKVLLAKFAAVALGWVLAILAFGHLAIRDIVGSVISAGSPRNGKNGTSGRWRNTQTESSISKAFARVVP